MKPEPGQSVINSRHAQTVVRPRNLAFERGKFWIKDLRGKSSVASAARLNLDVSFSEARRPLAGALAEAMGNSDLRLVLSRFESGRRCFAATNNDKVVAYCWVSRFAECIGEIEHEIHLLPDEAYIWDCATLPAVRNHGIYSNLLAYILSVLKEDGINYAWIGSSLDNTPSMRGFSRAGFSPVATLTYLRFFHANIMFIAGVPFADARLVASARRILTSNWPYTWGAVAFGGSEGFPVPIDIHSTCSDGTI